jgi:type VI secretion system secreted protein VgrG
VDRNNKVRGRGYELRTDEKGHLRAGGGMLVSADSQPQAQGQQTEMQPATSQFSLTQAQAQELADAALTAKAEVADLKSENEWLKNELADLKEAVLALSSPHGIGMATPGRMMVSTGKDLSVATSSGFNVNAFGKIAMAAKEAVSLFAHSSGIKLLAARGKVQVQALTDSLDMASKNDVFIRSTNGKVIIEAKDELLFKCGGSYLSIKPHSFTNATQGDYVERALSWQKSDPDGTMTKDALPYVNDIADLARHGSKFSG